ncbi:MAG: ribosomal protein S18 acetylase RimI-like enzyme [Alteromonadaceae bacterium]|jgi:ribosomal protein S18 acetylase RimI-like enzyme
MHLIPAKIPHIKEMMTWFDDEQSLFTWSGPNFKYPFSLSSFREDLKLSELSSFVLRDDKLTTLAFGQYYLRLGRCHLGRLVVTPHCRGQGIARQLMHELLQLGARELAVSEGSLFVLNHNKAAIKCYQSFGFVFTPYPNELPLENCLYMIKHL